MGYALFYFLAAPLRILRVMLCDIFRRYINNEFIPQLAFNLLHFRYRLSCDTIWKGLLSVQ